MKYIKLFENLIDPDIGCYVVCKDMYDDELGTFLSNAVGKIIDYYTSAYTIRYENIPIGLLFLFDNIEDYKGDRFFEQDEILYFSGDRFFEQDEILYFSDTREDCEIYLNTNKYNL